MSDYDHEPGPDDLRAHIRALQKSENHWIRMTRRLQSENAALRARVGRLEAEVKARAKRSE